MLPASDPWWVSHPLPFGHNCRCRRVTLSPRDIARRKLSVVDGSAIAGLPDAGWGPTSGSPVFSLPTPAPKAAGPRMSPAQEGAPTAHFSAKERVFGASSQKTVPGLIHADARAVAAHPAQASIVEEALRQIPETMQRAAVEHGAVVHVVGMLSDKIRGLRGTTPRGWPSGTYWDDLRGGFDVDEGAVIALAGTMGGGGVLGKVAPIANAAIHEWGHAIDVHGPVVLHKNTDRPIVDHLTGKPERKMFSAEDWWLEHWERITTKQPGQDVDALEAWVQERTGGGRGEYFRQRWPAGPQELWAETIAAAYQAKGNSRALLERHFPGLLDLIAAHIAEAWGI